MNKKGFLLAEETLKIVLAVIVIGFLIYLLASLYLSSKNDEEMNFADSSVRHLVEELNSNSKEVQIFNPEGWFINSWKKGNTMPSTCSSLNWENCICICENADCKERNSCLQYSKEIIIKGTNISIDNPPIILEINYGDKIGINKK